jgi:predicted nucleic acid-binding Zn ribbon protein
LIKCLVCGKEFEPINRLHKFCSKACSKKNYKQNHKEVVSASNKRYQAKRKQINKLKGLSAIEKQDYFFKKYRLEKGVNVK